jgi:hypothetical protein
LTPLIGREATLVQVVDFLQDPACRLLTLVGPGGIGKPQPMYYLYQFDILSTADGHSC